MCLNAHLDYLISDSDIEIHVNLITLIVKSKLNCHVPDITLCEHVLKLTTTKNITYCASLLLLLFVVVACH